MTLQHAWGKIQQLLASPSLVLLHETERHAEVFGTLSGKIRLSGNLVHDAHIAALLIEHSVPDILTADTDFLKFEQIRVINPFR